MKIARSLFGILICSLMLFSCQKPEGEIIDPWEEVLDDTLVSCSVKGGVDNAIYTIEINLNKVSEDVLTLETLDFTYWENGMQSSVITPIHVAKDLVLVKQDSVLRFSDTLESLQPNRFFSYQLALSDGFMLHDTIAGQFKTLDPTPDVRVDTVTAYNGVYTCRATINAYTKAMLTEPPHSFQLLWGYSPDEIVNDVPIDETQTVVETISPDSLSIHIVGIASTVSYGANVDVWFKAVVHDSWGNVAISEPYGLNSKPAVMLNGDPLNQYGENGSVTLYGKAVPGIENVTLYQCGFCYGFEEDPSMADLVVTTTSPAWGPFTYTLSDLEPEKTYYYRAFIQVNDGNGEVYYSSCGSFFTGGGDDPDDPDDPDVPDAVSVVVGHEVENPMISAAGLHVLTSSVEGDESLVKECGYLWKANPSEGLVIVSFDNCDGAVTSFRAGDADIPDEYAWMLPLLGVDATDYVALLDALDGETRYICRAYVKLTDDSVVYSEGTLVVNAPSVK